MAKAPYQRTRDQTFLLDPVQATYTISNTASSMPPFTRLSSGWSCSSSALGPQGTIMHDVVTPGFRQLSAQGLVINNPMSRVFSKTTIYPHSGVYATNKDSANLQTITVEGVVPDLGNQWVPPSLDLGDVSVSAINKAFANSNQVNVLAAVDVIEAGDTLNMIRTHVTAIVGLLRSARSGPRSLVKFIGSEGRLLNSSRRNIKIMKYRSRGFGGAVKGASDLWLSAQYGYIPLILSIEGLMKSLEDESNKRLTFRGFNSGNGEATTNFTGSAGATLRNIKISREIRCRAGLMTEFRPTFAQKMGLYGENSIVIGYELIPYSFVLDWIWDLNTWLQAINPPRGSSCLSSWLSTYDYIRTTFTLSSVGGITKSGGVTTTYNSWQAVIIKEVTNERRDPNIKPGIPPIDLNYRSLTHSISGVALILSRIISNPRGKFR